MSDTNRNKLIERHQLVEKCNRDLQFRSLTLERCKRDIVFFCDNFIFTSDPRLASQNKPITIPFLLFDKQKDCLRWLEECYRNKQFGIIAKSRDAGISYLCMLFHIHNWLFTDNYVGLIGSRKEILVDRLGDMSSLFGKIRFMIELLPSWMMKTDDYIDNYMKIINKKNGSSIVGEAGNNIGRGGRSSFSSLDEFSFLENQDKVNAAISQNTDCCIKVSTPNGNGDSFSRDYLSGLIPNFTIHWKDDPRKNKWIHEDDRTGNGWDSPIGAIYPWYEEQKLKLDPITLAQEVDINFDSSREGVCIPAHWVEAAIDFPIIMQGFKIQAGLDVATEGSNQNVFIIVDGGNKVTLIDTWSGLNTTETAYKVRDLCHSLGVHKLNFDADGVGAGVAGTLQTTTGLRFNFKALHGGSSPSDYYWVGEEKSSKDKFVNRRAELWYLARERFRKTYETRNNIRIYPYDECISIPNNRNLINQLSQPTTKYRDNGKMLIESKQDMKKRGVSSPDFADSLIYALANDTQNTFNQGIVRW